MTVYADLASNFHPYECDGPGRCVHCDRKIVTMTGGGKPDITYHDPATCPLCDPEYDGQPNAAWKATA